MKKCFLITAGGTGAKVAESVVHLCSAGLGPEELHVLVIDVDVKNGNVTRTLNTIREYQTVSAWPWDIRPQGPTDPTKNPNLRFFGTKIFSYKLREAIEGSLRSMVADDPTLAQFLEVLLDRGELDTDCRGGFAGRPNLGCLIAGQYLELHLVGKSTAAKDSGVDSNDAPPKADQLEARTAADFRTALIAASRDPEIAKVPVFVCGSIFGGTGSSFLPIAKGSCLHAFTLTDTEGDTIFAKLLWGRLLQLPYFRPPEKVGSNDPTLYQLNSCLALEHYQRSLPPTEPCYLVGSYSHHKKAVPPVAFGESQANPAFFHEILGGLACLDFFARPIVEQETQPKPVRFFNPSTTIEKADLRHLPSPPLPPHNPTLKGDEEPAIKSHDRLAILLHLAGFFHARWTADNRGTYEAGLNQYLSSFAKRGPALMCTGFYAELLQVWISSDTIRRSLGGDEEEDTLMNMVTLNDPSHPHAMDPSIKKAARYFASAYRWANSALTGAIPPNWTPPSATDEAVVVFGSRDRYVGLHNTICGVSYNEIAPSTNADDEQRVDKTDNIVARLLRAAAVSLLHEKSGRFGHELARPDGEQGERYRTKLKSDTQITISCGRENIAAGIKHSEIEY